jgi:hypothetical protein
MRSSGGGFWDRRAGAVIRGGTAGPSFENLGKNEGIAEADLLSDELEFVLTADEELGGALDAHVGELL